MAAEQFEYTTPSGLTVHRNTETVDVAQSVESLIDQLDAHRGVLLSSSYEYPGRYTRWDIGFSDPAVAVSAIGRTMQVESLNQRGTVLLAALDSLADAWVNEGLVTAGDRDGAELRLEVSPWADAAFIEEERSRQPSVFSVLRRMIAALHSSHDSHLGFYGAFGYDLAFQFEPVTLERSRDAGQRDLVLYVPDQLLVVDHKRELAVQHSYDFTFEGSTSVGSHRRAAAPVAFVTSDRAAGCDHSDGEYATTVRKAKEYFARGDLFEVVPGQVFSEGATTPPSELFRRLRVRNPSPYGALMNLGHNEYLVAASPEMYVRVEGRRVETCPISGTIARGDDVFGDADAIRQLLNSDKDAAELTMCTDVDRNDKSRICEPESIRVIGRRQIEVYSRLIHTVDHVEGILRPEFDALDAFLAHTWAVTVTGAPKLWAMRFIEEHEKSPRAWYGGAIGALLFNGNANTGLTLRTIHINDGVASVRAGATLLMDSDPDAEERETRTKAAALLDAIQRPDDASAVAPSPDKVGAGLNILLIDHEDSFVHTLAGYLRRTGAAVSTVRVAVGGRLDPALLQRIAPDLVVVSPGPGKPSDFSLDQTLETVLTTDTPVFGVCLGLQAIVEHFGGSLGQLNEPWHGRSSMMRVLDATGLDEVPTSFEAGRYHSLYADALPEALSVTIESEDGVIMGVRHKTLPVSAVQFHPESLMTMKGDVGMRLIEAVVRQVASG